MPAKTAQTTDTGTTKKKRDTVNLTGTAIFKTGSVQALKGDSCRLYLQYRDAATGKWKAKTRTYRSPDGKRLTLKAAKAALQAFALEEETRLGVASRYDVAGYVGAYIDEKAQARAASTIRTYRVVLERQIAPSLGAVALAELNPDMVAAWVAQQAESYKPRTVQRALTLLRGAMKQAVERDVLRKDPTRGVQAPKIVRENPNALDDAGRARVLEWTAEDPADPVRMACAMALLMAMRAGEVCGLQWRYVDLEGGTLRVALSLARNKQGEWSTKEPKTAASRRTLDIPAQLIAPLRELKAAAMAAAMEQGMDWRDYYVVGYAEGSPRRCSGLSKKWQKLATDMGLVGITGKRPTFHDLRHTWATKAVQAGVDIKTVSSVMGHTNAAMTLNIYASADPKAKRAALQAVSDAMHAERARAEVLAFPATGTEG